PGPGRPTGGGGGRRRHPQRRFPTAGSATRTGSARSQSTAGSTGGETKRAPVGAALTRGLYLRPPASASAGSYCEALAGRKCERRASGGGTIIVLCAPPLRPRHSF